MTKFNSAAEAVAAAAFTKQAEASKLGAAFLKVASSLHGRVTTLRDNHAERLSKLEAGAVAKTNDDESIISEATDALKIIFDEDYRADVAAAAAERRQRYKQLSDAYNVRCAEISKLKPGPKAEACQRESWTALKAWGSEIKKKYEGDCAAAGEQRLKRLQNLRTDIASELSKIRAEGEIFDE